MKAFHADGTPKSLNNAFTLSKGLDKKWISDLKVSINGSLNGAVRAAQMGSERVSNPVAKTLAQKWVKENVTLEDIKNNTRLDGECWIWQGSYDKTVPVISRRHTSDAGKLKVRVRIRALILENVFKNPPALNAKIYMTCNKKGCCNPDHIAVSNVNSTKD